MWLCLAYCQKDLQQAKDLLSWCHQLDSQLSHGILLTCDPSVDWGDASDLLALAAKVFQRVELIAAEVSIDSWPAGPNSLFKTAAQWFQARRIGPWLWCEPDAAPIRKGWLDAFEADYFAKGKPFMGTLMTAKEPNLPKHYLPGIAVYPYDAWTRMAPAWRDDAAFDVATASATLPFAADTNLIMHLWGQKDLPPTFVEATPEFPANDFTVPNRNKLTLANIKPEAVLFHRVKDGTLIELLSMRHYENNGEVYAHGGDVGDLIYGMAAMKALGRRPLVLHKHGVREAWSREKVRRIAPLLKLQPYISDVIYSDTLPNTKFNFNPFREKNWSMRSGPTPESLCDTQLKMFGIPTAKKTEPWIQVDRPTEIPGKPVIIHRSPRYHNPGFPWPEIHRKYGKMALFVGMPGEHADWQKKFGKIDYYPTDDYLELARMIAGAGLFIGNQSCPYAIAEAMKQTAILESFPWAPDCQFTRPNLINEPTGTRITLPGI